MKRLVLVAFLLALVGCQLGTTDEPATPTSTTSSLDAARAKLERRSTASSLSVVPLTNDVPIGGPPTTRPSTGGDGICSHEERGSNSTDCGQASTDAVPTGWVPCGQTGAYCPPEPLSVDHWPIRLRARWSSWTPSPYRPIGPYRVVGPDPNDGDDDGVACESGCRS